MRRLTPRRLAILAVLLGLGAAVVAVVAVLGAGAGLWPPLAGVTALGLCVAVAVVGVIDGLAALLLGRRGGGEPRLALLGILAGAALVGTWVVQQRQAAFFPATHDAGTGGSGPAFRHFTIVPGAPVEDAGVPPLRTPWPVAETLRRVLALGRAFGWRQITVDGNHLEATDISSAFGFEDAIAIEVIPSPDGHASVLMRSAARTQRGGDGGRNAARVRGFLKSLAGSAHPAPHY